MSRRPPSDYRRPHGNIRATSLRVGLAVAAAAAVAPPAQAAVYLDSQPRQPLIDFGNKLVAANGGPAVTMVIDSLDYPVSANNGLFVNGELVLSGTLGPRDAYGRLTVLGATHSIQFGTTPDRITRIRIFTGTNWLTDPGQVLQVDLSTLRMMPGYDRTFGTADLFGAKLIGGIPGLGNISIAAAGVGEIVVHAGNGFYGTPSERAKSSLHRDFQMMGWKAEVLKGVPLDVSDQYYNASTWGGPSPSAISVNGDSNGPVLRYDSIQWSETGRVLSLALAGMENGSQFITDTSGRNVYTDFGNQTARWFIDSVLAGMPGDANANGRIDADDFALIDRGFAKGLTGWANGDFNGDGKIDAGDYLILDRAFANAGNLLSPALLAEREAAFGGGYVESLLAAVPEPGGVLGLAGCAVAGLAGRRRQRRS